MNLHKILNTDHDGRDQSPSLKLEGPKDSKAENAEEESVENDNLRSPDNDNDGDMASSLVSRPSSSLSEIESSRKRAAVSGNDNSLDQDLQPASSSSLSKTKLKRLKAKNSTWTLEEDRTLIGLVMNTLPIQDFTEYARILNKRDSQTVRYRWKVILRRARAED
jgi:Myb-like DNA-binding domain